MEASRVVEPIGISGVVVRGRLRPLDDDAVRALMNSITKIGLQSPITVRIEREFDGRGNAVEETPVLIAGAHRLEAAKRLGWHFIDAYVFEGDERDARMWEIAENLHRADLTVLERSEQVSEWVRLAEEREVLAQLAPKPQGGRPQGGTRAAARDIGVTRDEARRSEKVAALAPEAKEAARAAGLDDNQSALLAAAKAETAAAQVEVLNRRAAERARTHGEVKDAKADAREVLACAIAEHIPEYKLSDVGGALALLGMKEIAARVQTLTGAVFDKGRVSEAA